MLCQAGVLQSLKICYSLKGPLVQHWEVPSTLSEVKTQLKIVLYNFFKKMSKLLTDWILFTTRTYIFLLDFTCATIVRVPGS